MHAWEKSEGSGKLRIWRVVNFASLLIAAAALFLALKKPAPVAQPQARAALSANAQSFQSKVDQLAQPPEAGQSNPEIHLTGDEVAAAFAQAAAPVPPPAAATQVQSASVPPSTDASVPIAPGAIDVNSL